MKNKKGKKLVVLGAMAALLTLIGVSGSQTYAKYIESTTVPTQQATVAKWGYVVSANATKMFANEHDTTQTGVSSSAKSGGVSISAANEVVAPGAFGSITFGVEGSAEVASYLTFTFNVVEQVELFKAAEKIDANSVYLPILWTLKNTLTSEVLVDSKNDLSLVESALEDKSDFFSPGAPVKEMYELSYVWPFESGKDEYDTVLGHLAQGDLATSTLKDTYAGYSANLNVNFSIDIEIEQVQKDPTPLP